MIYHTNSGLLRKTRRSGYEFQHTFGVPNKLYSVLLDILYEALGGPQKAVLVVDKTLGSAKSLSRTASLDESITISHDCSFESETTAEFLDMVSSAFFDGVDFLLLTPGKFAVYSDHDQYITFLANRKSALNLIVEKTREANFPEKSTCRRSF